MSEEFDNYLNHFLKPFNDLCTVHASLKPYLDEPSTHFLLELVIHTILLYSHSHFESALMFGAGHPPLRYAISRSTNRNTDLQILNTREVIHIYLTEAPTGPGHISSRS